MLQTLTNKLSVLLAAAVLALGFAFTAFAYVTYDQLTIDVTINDTSIDFDVEYVDETNGTTTEQYSYTTTDLDTAYADLADDLDVEQATVEAAIDNIDDQTTSSNNDDDDDEDEEEDDDDDDEDEDDNDNRGKKDKSEKCETNPALTRGVAVGLRTQCGVDTITGQDQASTTRARVQDKYKDYGKTTDRTELQSQLRELLLLLIQLLQQQMATQAGN